MLRSKSDLWAVSAPSMAPGDHKPWFRPWNLLWDNGGLPAYLKDPRFLFKVSRPSFLWLIMPLLQILQVMFQETPCVLIEFCYFISQRSWTIEVFHWGLFNVKAFTVLGQVNRGSSLDVLLTELMPLSIRMERHTLNCVASVGRLLSPLDWSFPFPCDLFSKQWPGLWVFTHIPSDLWICWGIFCCP